MAYRPVTILQNKCSNLVDRIEHIFYNGVITLRTGVDYMNQSCREGKDMAGDNGNDAEFYKREINKIIGTIENAGTLEYLHSFIIFFLKKWG